MNIYFAGRRFRQAKWMSPLHNGSTADKHWQNFRLITGDLQGEK